MWLHGHVSGCVVDHVNRCVDDHVSHCVVGHVSGCVDDHVSGCVVGHVSRCVDDHVSGCVVQWLQKLVHAMTYFMDVCGPAVIERGKQRVYTWHN